MPAHDALDDDGGTIREMVEPECADITCQQMMAAIVQRTASVRAKFLGIDVTTLGEEDWREWLSAHHYAERDRAKSRRAEARHILKAAARAAGQPWKPNDPRARGDPASPPQSGNPLRHTS